MTVPYWIQQLQNEYNQQSFDQVENYVRRNFRHQQAVQNYGMMVQRELEMEQELLEAYPELAPMVYKLNQAERMAEYSGVADVLGGAQTDLIGDDVYINSLFPGL
jgi:hypothetical protein